VRRKVQFVLPLAAATVAGCEAAEELPGPRAGDTFVTEARTDPALMQVVPDVVPAGGELEAVFPSGADRGPGFVLERHGEEGRAWRFAISSGTCSTAATSTPGGQPVPVAVDGRLQRRWCATRRRRQEAVRRDTITELRSSGSSRRLADVVLWRPAWFGAKPETVLKDGWFAWGAWWGGQRIGPPGATGPLRPAPRGRGSRGRGVERDLRVATRGGGGRGPGAGLGRRTSVIRDLRDLGRDRLHANRTTLPVEVAAGGTVHARGRVLAAGPVRSLPLNRRFRLS
jgi:hypothetical protein